jgi:hypothetical protein
MVDKNKKKERIMRAKLQNSAYKKKYNSVPRVPQHGGLALHKLQQRL